MRARLHATRLGWRTTPETAMTKKRKKAMTTTKGIKKGYFYYGNRNIPMMRRCYVKRAIGSTSPADGFLGSIASVAAPPDGLK